MTVATLMPGEANTGSASTATIDSLANELLTDIFVIGREDSAKPHTYEMEVSHVSRRWRSMAVNAGALWTNISVTCWRLSEVICLYLKRSGSYPLYVTLNPDGRHEYFDISPFRNNIIPHIHAYNIFFAIRQRIQPYAV